MQVIYWEACFRHMLEAVPLARYVQLWPSKSICFFIVFCVLKKFL